MIFILFYHALMRLHAPSHPYRLYARAALHTATLVHRASRDVTGYYLDTTAAAIAVETIVVTEWQAEYFNSNQISQKV